MGDAQAGSPHSVSLFFGLTFTQKSPLPAPRYSYPNFLLHPSSLLRPLPASASLLG